VTPTATVGELAEAAKVLSDPNWPPLYPQIWLRQL
jgi:hypothetical protein